MFDPKSRYAKLGTVHVVDRRGRTVEAVPPAPHAKQSERGIHVRKHHERADYLAALYVGDATAAWRLAEMSDAMTTEVLSELRELSIPNPLIEDGGQ